MTRAGVPEPNTAGTGYPRTSEPDCYWSRVYRLKYPSLTAPEPDTVRCDFGELVSTSADAGFPAEISGAEFLSRTLPVPALQKNFYPDRFSGGLPTPTAACFGLSGELPTLIAAGSELAD